MARQSSVTRLPASIRDEIGRMIREGGHTLDEILTHLRTLGSTGVSRSALGRYRKTLDERMAVAREAREIAAVWVEKLGAEPQGDVGRLLVEMLRTVAFQTVGVMGDEGEVKPSEVGVMARALRDLATADKSAVEREIVIKKRLVADLARGGDQGAPLDHETLDAVRQILGVSA
ncbi:MAG: DUF3486 family protein [Magnetococcales bacterium]|nr:DUF3486 family protein [Magnetococcales bacterium]